MSDTGGAVAGDPAAATEELRPVRLVLVRHGESNATVQRVIGGPRTCNGLSELGRLQVERLAQRLAHTGELTPDLLCASAYPRAIETAEAIAGVWGLDVVVDAGFGEHDPGPDCDGMSFHDYVTRYGMPDWETDPHGPSFPGGETVAEFHHRVGRAVSQLVSANPGATVVVCCHGGVVDTVLRSLLRWPSTGGFEMHTTNASLTELAQVRRGRWRLVRYNDAAHLAGLAVTAAPSG